MLLVTPEEQFLSRYVVSVPRLVQFSENYVNLVADKLKNFTLEGRPLPGNDAIDVKNSGKTVLRVKIDDSMHVFEGTRPFGLTSYGYGFWDAYTYSGGFATKNLAP